MTEPQWYPPPGAPVPPGHQQPPPGQQAWTAPPGATPPPGWQPQPGMLGAAHKPGAVALRPLRLGDLFDAAFRIIRYNPKATVGAAVLVSSVTMAIPIVVTTLVTLTLGATISTTDDGGFTTDDGLGVGLAVGSLVLGYLLLQVGLLMVTAMVAAVTHEAAVGRRCTLSEAWARTRGKRWRMVGLMLVTLASVLVAMVVLVVLVVATAATGSVVAAVVVAVLGGIGLLVLFAFARIRLVYLAAPALVLEDLGVFAALGRSFALTRRQFWRVLGLALLAGLMAGVAGNLLSTPIVIAGEVGAVLVPSYALVILALMQALATVLSSAFTAPFTASVASLQYLDQRMRKEAYAVELMSQAGLI